MYKLIKTLCTKCKSYFENSEQSCISTINLQDKISLLLKPSTKLEVKITRKIKQFCKIAQNRFWTIYYRISESKIYFSCNRCNKSDLCKEYILGRVIKHIKAFDIEQESVVFKKIRENLTKKETQLQLDKNTQEVVSHYTQKINKEYEQKAFDFDMGSAFIENILEEIEDETQKLIERRVDRYRLYKAPIILRDFISESLGDEHTEIKKPILIELLQKEKFVNYIKQPIESRFVDFVRSKQYNDEVDIETESNDVDNGNNDDIESLLKNLSSQQQIIYKLKYGIRLDNREFLNITYKLNYLDKTILDEFTPDEKLYIKFSVYYEIDDDSEHLFMIDVKEVKQSILKKISDYRGKLESHSYIDTHKEIFIKLIYSEPLSAKEIGTVFDLTSRQIDKKVENIKIKLKKLEQKA